MFEKADSRDSRTLQILLRSRVRSSSARALSVRRSLTAISHVSHACTPCYPVRCNNWSLAPTHLSLSTAARGNVRARGRHSKTLRRRRCKRDSITTSWTTSMAELKRATRLMHDIKALRKCVSRAAGDSSASFGRLSPLRRPATLLLVNFKYLSYSSSARSLSPVARRIRLSAGYSRIRAK